MAKQDDYVRYTIRVPADLYAQLQEAAGEKSMNAEIVYRLERTVTLAKVLEDYARAEERLAEQAKTERELRRQIELLEEQVAMLKTGEAEIDLSSPAVQDAMIQRVKEVMNDVADDMREEQRIANGMPLLLRWFDENPDEREAYDRMPEAEQDEFVREQAHALWIEYLNAQRQARPAKKPTVIVRKEPIHASAKRPRAIRPKDLERAKRGDK